jgi:hypothetical protein
VVKIHAIAVEFLRRDIPRSHSMGRDPGREGFQGDVEREAPKMVDAKHARGLLKRGIVPGHAIQFDFSADVIKAPVEKMLWVGEDRPVDPDVTFPVVVGRPRQWKPNTPDSQANCGNDELQRAAQPFSPAQSEPTAFGFRLSAFELCCDHLIYLSHVNLYGEIAAEQRKGLEPR